MAAVVNPRFWRLLLAAFLCFSLFSISLQTALANSADIPAGDVYFERRSATTGSKLSWQWNTSGTVAFSIARIQDPGTLLHSREGIEDAGSVTIPFDDTYILLWFNPGNLTVTLNYSSAVEAGTGSTFLYVVVVLILAVLLLVTVVFIGRRRRSEAGGGEPPEGLSQSQKVEMPSTELPPPGRPLGPMPPPPPPPVPQPPGPGQGSAAGNIFCRRCGQPSSQEAVFCADCGYPLG